MPNTLDHIDAGTAVYHLVQSDNSDLFSAVSVSIPNGRSWVINCTFKKLSRNEFEGIVKHFRNDALAAAADQFATLNRNKALDYVKTLPPGKRSPLLDGKNAGMRQEAEEDIRHALAKALTFEDPYRAAVMFESCIPFLIGDRRMVDMIDTVHTDFINGFDECEWISMVAEELETSIKNSSNFSHHHLSIFKKDDCKNS